MTIISCWTIKLHNVKCIKSFQSLYISYMHKPFCIFHLLDYISSYKQNFKSMYSLNIIYEKWFQLPNCYSEWCDFSGNYFIIEEYISTQVRNNIFDYQPVLVASNNIGKTPSLSRISKYMNLVILSLANINNDLSRNHYKYLEYFVDSFRVSYHTFSQIY